MIKTLANCRAYILGVLFFLTVALWYVFIITPWTIICIVFNLKKIYPKIQPPFYHAFFFLFGIKTIVSGKEHLPKNGQFIVLSNHQSFLDIPLIVAATGHVAFLAKEELFRIPIFGWAIRNSGSLEVYRKDPRKNVGLPERMKKNIEKGHNFCAFPEGTRSVDQNIASFKGGIFKYIKEIEHQVIPVTIVNSNIVLHKKSIKFFPGRIEMCIHPPIPYNDLKDMEVGQMRDSIRSIIISGMPSQR